MSNNVPDLLELQDIDALFDAIGDRVVSAWQEHNHSSARAWRQYCDSHLTIARYIRYPPEKRQELSARFTRHGMSTRAIAMVMGTNDGTVRADLRKLGISGDRPVIAMNGKVWDPKPDASPAAASVSSASRITVPVGS